MHLPGLQMRLLIDSLQHKAVIVFGFGLPNEIVVEIVDLHLIILAAEHVVGCTVDLQRLPFPYLQVEAASVCLTGHQIPILSGVMVLIALDSLNEVHSSNVIIQFLEVALLAVGDEELFG